MERIPDVDLLMIGKTGNGKSALGNAILKRNVFKADCSLDSVTKECSFEFSEYRGKVIKVVDGPGVGDTRLNTPDAVQLVVKAMETAMVANPRGYNAFLLVVRYGMRFTAEDKDTVRFLKDMFGGEEFVRRHCILVMTYGDDFKRQRARGQGGGADFNGWCRNQTGVFQELLAEVDNRIVLFDNDTTDEETRNAQIDRLLALVDSLQHQGARYRDAHFQRAQATRDRAVVESGKPELREGVVQETSLILQKLDEVRDSLQLSEQISPLEELLTRCDVFLAGLREQDRGTGALDDLLESVSAVRHSVTDAIRVQTVVLEERRKAEAAEEKFKLQMEQQLSRQRKEFDELVAQQKRTEEERRQMEKEFSEKRERLEEERRGERDRREQELMGMLERERQLMQEKSQQLEQAYRNCDSGGGCNIL